MQMMTPRSDEGRQGCQSCLVHPPCNGRLQLPNAGLILTPDPLACGSLSQRVVQILPTPLLQPLFERIEKIKEVIPEQMMGEIH